MFGRLSDLKNRFTIPPLHSIIMPRSKGIAMKRLLLAVALACFLVTGLDAKGPSIRPSSGSSFSSQSSSPSVRPSAPAPRVSTPSVRPSGGSSAQPAGKPSGGSFDSAAGSAQRRSESSGVKSKPLFRTRKQYEQFRERFEAAVKDELEQHRIARAKSAVDAVTHWAD